MPNIHLFIKQYKRKIRNYTEEEKEKKEKLEEEEGSSTLRLFIIECATLNLGSITLVNEFRAEEVKEPNILA